MNHAARRPPDDRGDEPQDRLLPGPFHVERRAVRLHRRLPRRRRDGLPRRPRRLLASPTATRWSTSAADQLGRSRRAPTASRSPSRWTRSPTSITSSSTSSTAPPASTPTPTSASPPAATARPATLFAWRETIAPERATDLDGTTDLTATLASFDRDTADGFRRHVRWVGYAEEHGIVLDFGDRLARFGPDDRLVLCLAGWVEYPYSQTNYAASTAGVASAASRPRTPRSRTAPGR